VRLQWQLRQWPAARRKARFEEVKKRYPRLLKFIPPLLQDNKPMGYSLQEKSALEKSQFIKARMGLSAEVSLSRHQLFKGPTDFFSCYRTCGRPK
jgi:hypothetical protein